MVTHRNYYQNLYLNKTIPLNEDSLSGLPAFSALPISNHFSKNNILKISIKTVSDRARNPKNHADAGEMEAINYFKNKPINKEYYSELDSIYQYATPLYIEEKCLKCHGAKENAPLFIQKRYADAYNYKLGELRGIVSVKIPKEEIDPYFMNKFIGELIHDLFTLIFVFSIIYFFIGYFKKLHNRMEELIEERTAELTHSNTMLENYKKMMDENSIISKTDIDGIITYANENFLHISGYSQEELLGENHKLLSSQIHPKEFWEEMYDTLKYKKIWRGEICNLKKDGHLYWTNTTILSTVSIEGKVEGYTAIRIDITARKDAESGLNKLLKLQQAVFENTTILISTVNKEGIITSMNAAAQKELGYNSKELVGIYTPEIIHKKEEIISHAKKLSHELGIEMRSGFEVLVAEAKSNLINNNEWTYIRKDGSEFFVNLSVAALRDANDIIYGYVGMATNITQQKKKDTIIASQNRLAALGEMISNIAHQWRQPLATINSILLNLEVGIDIKELKTVPVKQVIDVTTEVKNYTNYLSKTIDDFRNFGKVSDIQEDFKLIDMINQSKRLIEHTYNFHNIKIDINTQKDIENIYVTGSKRELVQAILNILNNAKDALIEMNTEDPLVNIELYIKSNHVFIEIIDNAGGIAQDILIKIFDPYFTTKHESVGTGIGLSTSKEIVDTHFLGNLSAHNNKDGAVFVIKLLIAKTDL